MPIFEDNRTPEEKEERRRLLALPFRMVIEDVFDVKVRGLVVIGRVETGQLKKDDPILIQGKEISIKTYVKEFEGFMRDRDTWVAEPGDNTAIILRDLMTDEEKKIQRGMIVTTEGI